jgi:chromosome segregation ATPase
VGIAAALVLVCVIVAVAPDSSSASERAPDRAVAVNDDPTGILRQSLQQTTAERDALQHENTRINRQKTDAERTVRTLKEQSVTDNNTVQDLNAKVDSLSKSVSERESAVDEIERQAAAEKADLLADAQRVQSDQIAENSRLKSQIGELEGKLKDCQREKEFLTNDLSRQGQIHTDNLHEISEMRGLNTQLMETVRNLSQITPLLKGVADTLTGVREAVENWQVNTSSSGVITPPDKKKK